MRSVSQAGASQGTEDLRLSEALMQFLGAANSLVAGSGHSRGRQAGLQARTFGVIPVGPQAGLIEWLQDARPIYSIWQAWHQRTALRTGSIHSTGMGTPGHSFLHPRMSSCVHRCAA